MKGGEEANAALARLAGFTADDDFAEAEEGDEEALAGLAGFDDDAAAAGLLLFDDAGAEAKEEGEAGEAGLDLEAETAAEAGANVEQRSEKQQ